MVTLKYDSWASGEVPELQELQAQEVFKKNEISFKIILVI